MPPSRVALSKAMSHALRHAPWLYELELDDEGWAPLPMLLLALRERGPAWSDVDRAHVDDVMRDSAKRRFEISGDRIRALYGHSLPGRLTREPARPPGELFHGTSPQAAAAILREGLRPMTRQYVHLSVDVATAVQVASRKSASPLVLRIDAAGAADAGVRFYHGNEHVWLADTVPGHYLDVLDR